MTRILAACSPGEVRVAVVADGLTDYAVWRRGRPDGVGDLHLGRVSARVRPLGGSFVALAGHDADHGFLPDTEQPAPQPVGAMIAVRITRAAQAGKGPRLTAHLTEAERGRGAEGPMRLLHRGPGPIERFAAQHPDAAVVIDAPAIAALLHPLLGARLHLARRAFDDALEDDIAALASERVDVPGGGLLRIQPTAALVAIDIDTGGGLAGGSAKTAAHAGFNNALLPQLARQIRLRNLSGAILVDIAGLSARQRGRIAAPLQAALAADPIACRLVGFTGLGLAEILRRRVHPPLHEVLGGPHAAACAALRAAVANTRPGTRLALSAAPDVIGAYDSDPAMQADLAAGTAHDLMIRSNPSAQAGTWQLQQHTEGAR